MTERMGFVFCRRFICDIHHDARIQFISQKGKLPNPDTHCFQSVGIS